MYVQSNVASFKSFTDQGSCHFNVHYAHREMSVSGNVCVCVCLSVYFEEVGYVGIHNLALGNLSEDICMCRILIPSGSVMNYSFYKFYLQKSVFLSDSFKV